MIRSEIRHWRQTGFSLTELMVAMAILSVVMIAIMAVFSRSSRTYTTQNVAAALQQEVRAAVEVIAREARMAAYDPLAKNDFNIEVATASRLRFASDLNGTGKIDDGLTPKVSNKPAFPNCEKLSFSYIGSKKSVEITCGEATGSPDRQTLIGGDNSDTKVRSLTFRYLNKEGNETSFKNDIRAVLIDLEAEAPAGQEGMIARSYSTRVEFRNAAINAANN